MTKRKKPKRIVTSPPRSNEMAMEIQIRKRYCNTWPSTILELTKRVQSVNQTWSQVIGVLMRIPGLRISWYRDTKIDQLIVEVRYRSGTDVDEVELHEITSIELATAHLYIEVLLMDKLRQSKLIPRIIKDVYESKTKPKPELPG